MNKDYSRLSLGELADQYRSEWDAQDELNKQAKAHGDTMREIEAVILGRMADESLEDVKTDVITLSRREELAPKVTDWESVQGWMARNGRWEFMRKQLNTGPFKEMVEAGEPMPDGLEISTFVKLNRRRK